MSRFQRDTQRDTQQDVGHLYFAVRVWQVFRRSETAGAAAATTEIGRQNRNPGTKNGLRKRATRSPTSLFSPILDFFFLDHPRLAGWDVPRAACVAFFWNEPSRQKKAEPVSREVRLGDGCLSTARVRKK